jgi:general secretion pathway protein F
MNSQAVTLDELVALNDEIVALVRAGVPLELGLEQYGRDGTGVLAQLGTRLASRMSRGESLAEAVAAEGHALPATYRAVVVAGLRAGRLPAALEAISEFARRMAELRRRLGMALLYPLIVLVLAYGLFVLFILQRPVPILEDTFESMRVETPGFVERMADMGRSASEWAWIPLIPLGVAVLWWWGTQRAGTIEFRGLSRPLAWIPGVAAVGRDFRHANFANLLALLVEHDVPLGEAIRLAADATSDERLRLQALAMADAVQTGATSTGAPRHRGGFPPFLDWLLSRPTEQAGLVKALRAAGDMYHRRAETSVDWLRVVFPALAAVVVGGGATLLYCLTVFLPLTSLLRGLSG